MTLEHLKEEAFGLGIREFYSFIRNKYLEKHGFETEAVGKEGIENVTRKISNFLGIEEDKLWEIREFHLGFRITDVDLLSELGIEDRLIEGAGKSVEKGRKLSILPLNVLLGGDTIKKFVPSLPELYEPEHDQDPYGIFTEESRIWAGKKLLGARKFDYAVLANITSNCPTGCSSCYKGSITRLEQAALAKLSPRYEKIAKLLDQKEHEAIEQVTLLSEWLDKHKEVDTVILSGGEPLTFLEKTIGIMLDRLSETKYVKAIRICTSSVYQGSFFYLTDSMIETLGKCKKQLYINAHVTDEHQLLAPESRIVTEKLRKAGLSIHLQMPLMEGINFYRDNTKKSAEKLKRICSAAYEIGAVPYKAIVDMHSPKHPSLTVPIEKVSETISFLDSHFETSDMARWQAYNILHPQGNAYVYGAPHFAAEKEIMECRVTYFIPKIDPIAGISVHTYEEPLLPGLNDRELPKIADKRFSEKIDEVRKAYSRFRKQEIDAREFCRISGIRFSKNNPLTQQPVQV